MITYDSLAGITETISGVPGPVLTAVGILVMLGIVIAVRLYLIRKNPAAKSPENRAEPCRPGIFFGETGSSISEQGDENRDTGRSSGQETSGCSRRHVP